MERILITIAIVGAALLHRASAHCASEHFFLPHLNRKQVILYARSNLVPACHEYRKHLQIAGPRELRTRMKREAICRHKC